MKKHLLFLAVSLISINAFSQNAIVTPLECELLDSGEVNLFFYYSINGESQKMKSYIGHEKWSNPYAIKEKCEKLKFEVIQMPHEYWSHYECQNYGIAEAEKRINLPLTKNGKAIAGPGAESLLFRPAWPVKSEFIDTKTDVGCDPS